MSIFYAFAQSWKETESVKPSSLQTACVCLWKSAAVLTPWFIAELWWSPGPRAKIDAICVSETNKKKKALQSSKHWSFSLCPDGQQQVKLLPVYIAQRRVLCGFAYCHPSLWARATAAVAQSVQAFGWDSVGVRWLCVCSNRRHRKTNIWTWV